MATLTTLGQSWNNSTTLSRTYFEKANATFVAEHNIISGLYCASKKQPLKPAEHLPIFVTES